MIYCADDILCTYFTYYAVISHIVQSFFTYCMQSFHIVCRHSHIACSHFTCCAVISHIVQSFHILCSHFTCCAVISHIVQSFHILCSHFTCCAVISRIVQSFHILCSHVTCCAVIPLREFSSVLTSENFYQSYGGPEASTDVWFANHRNYTPSMSQWYEEHKVMRIFKVKTFMKKSFFLSFFLS